MLVLTLLGVARLAPKECTLTHQLEPARQLGGGSDPWSYSAYQSSIVQVLCHPSDRVAGLRERVVGLSGGTVPRLLAVFRVNSLLARCWLGLSSLLVEVSRLSSPLTGRVEILSTSKKSMGSR